MIDDPGQDEQEIGKAVHVPQQRVACGRIQRDDTSLGAAADCPRHVKRRPRHRAAGEDETAERRQLLFEPVDQRLEPGDICIGDGRLPPSPVRV